VYDVIEKKTLTRRRSRIPCVVVENIRRVDVKTATTQGNRLRRAVDVFRLWSTDKIRAEPSQDQAYTKRF